MRKKLLAILLVVMTFGAVFTISAFAGPVKPYKSVTITSSDTWKRSGSVAGTYKMYCGSNYSSSKRAMYVDVYQSDGHGYKIDKETRISAGHATGDMRTTTFSSSRLFLVELNPYGIGTAGCNGVGYIWYDM